MTEESYPKRRRGSLVIPILLITIGLLFLLDNLNIVSIDWASIWKLWPVLLIAVGLEVILGRRVSFGAILLIVIVVVIGGAFVWWSVAVGTDDRTVEHIVWPMNGVERAELELEVGVSELQLIGHGDMSDLLIADLDLAPGVEADHSFASRGDAAQGRIRIEKAFFAVPQIFGGKASKWDLRLNDRVRWEMDVSSGVGDVRLDLSDLRVSDLKLDSGVGSVDVTMPERGSVEAKIDGGIGDIRVNISEGTQARVKVDRGIGNLTIGSRFTRRGDYYETEGFGGAEGFVDLTVDVGVGSVTIR